jgi:hypothetical protein
VDVAVDFFFLCRVAGVIESSIVVAFKPFLDMSS